MSELFTPTDSLARVLLVDDQALIGEAVRRMLAGERGIEFHFCPDPQRAVSTAAAIRPSVILQDLVMPGVDGLELLARYRSTPGLLDVPTIVLSTKEDPKIKSEAFSGGAHDYLVKLPDVIELVARIRYHSRSYQAMQERDEAFRALRQSQDQLLEANRTLERLSRADGLTGLANRRHFDESLDLEWRRALRGRHEVSLLMIDVDHFKKYNDHYGHVAGDDTLRRVAACLAEVAHRGTDTVARYGGEEFAIILPATGPAGAHLVAEKVRLAVEALAIPHGAPAAGAHVTVSIGLACMPPHIGDDAAALVEQADLGLYQAKEKGRNRVGWVDPG